MKDRLFTVGFMGGLTFVTISAVSLLHLATADLVRANEKLYLKRAVMAAAGSAVPSSAAEVEEWFTARVTPAAGGQGEPSRFRVRGEHASGEPGHILVRKGAGLWGAITAVIGLSPDRTTLTGVVFVQHNETPGLGARISEPWFTEQFRGRTGPLRLVPEGTRSPVPQEIDAITGATITSKAVRDLLNRTLAEAGTMGARTDLTWIGE